MNKKLMKINEHRNFLINKAAEQRKELSKATEPMRVYLSIADKGLHTLEYVTKRPFLIAGAVALIVLVKPKRWVFILQNGWMAWRLLLAAKQKFQGNELIKN